MKIIFFLLSVGTFYNMGKSKSKVNGIMWAFSVNPIIS